MTVINVDVPDVLARQFVGKKVISIDALYEVDDSSDNWKTVKVGEKASVVLDYLKSIK